MSQSAGYLLKMTDVCESNPAVIRFLFFLSNGLTTAENSTVLK